MKSPLPMFACGFGAGVAFTHAIRGEWMPAFIFSLVALSSALAGRLR